MSKKMVPEFRFTPAILIQRRKLLKFTQYQAAELIGVNKQSVHHWEKGRNKPSHKNKARLVQFMNASPKKMLLLELQERAKKLNGK